MSRLESMITTDILKGKLTEETGEVSAQFLRGAKEALGIYQEWGLKSNVDLSKFTPVPHVKNEAKRVGAFFTLGVDSFYTLMTNVDDIDDLIYVKGFEAKIKQPRLMEDILLNIQHVARYFGKNTVFWISDIRNSLDRHVDWYTYGHGPALAAAALLREDTYKKIYIPASYTRQDAGIKCASHPAIDPLWSTESLTFVHDGPISRPDKLRRLSQSKVALDMLRVCYQGTSYNCGVCTKCVRTMLTLNLLGLRSCFGERPPLEHINHLAQEELRNPNRGVLWRQNIEEAEKLLKALKGQL